MKMEYKNRLAELRGDMSQEKFASLIGLKQQNYWKYENGKQGMRSDLIERICTTFNCTAEWLLCLDLEPSGATRAERKPGRLAPVPLYGRVAAGVPIEMLTVEEMKEAPTRYVEDDRDAYLVRVVGDSMNRLVHDGEFALVSPKYTEPNEHDMFLVTVNGDDATIKHVHKLANGVELVPDSFDPTYRPQAYDFGEADTPPVRILGKVVWWCKEF